MANKHGPASMSLRQIAEFHASVLRALPEMSVDVAQSWIENPIGLAAVLREVLNTNNTYLVTVDYALSLSARVKSGGYSWVEKPVDEEHVQIERSGNHEVEIVLLHLNRAAPTAEVEAELDKRSLRPANSAELLALGATYPDLQRMFPIAALGVLSRIGMVLVLDRSSRGRELSHRSLDRTWRGYYRFAAVRK